MFAKVMNRQKGVRLVLFCLCSLLMLGLMTHTGGTAGAAVEVSAISETGATDVVGKPVSYGLRVLAGQEEIVLSGLCGNEITFGADDICRGLNLSSIPSVTITQLSDPAVGTLFAGAEGVAVGQTIPAGTLSLLSFSATDSSRPCEATIGFTIPGSGYEITCRLCLLSKINYTPTTALASSVSLEVMTYRDMVAQGTLSAYDPEGDELTYEIISYASHGRIRLEDKHTGAYTYTPDGGYVGTDAFRYVVKDRYGNYSTGATVTVTVSELPTGVSFADTEGDACAVSALRLGTMGVMNGIRVGDKDYFRPTQEITRAEFLATAMYAVGIDPEQDSFTQASATKLLSAYADADSIPEGSRLALAYALDCGYFAGKTGSDGKQYLRPDESISRAEAAVLLSNMIGYARNTAVTAFADADSLPTWSVQALSSLRSLGILCSTDNTANAAGRMTRGDTAIWLERTIRLIAG